jgi:hypothetical protein
MDGAQIAEILISDELRASVSASVQSLDTINAHSKGQMLLASRDTGATFINPAEKQAINDIPAAAREFGDVIFYEDFGGVDLDRTRWPIVYDSLVNSNGAFKWDKSLLSVRGGNLHIYLEKQKDGIWNVGGLGTMPSAWAPGFSFTYGKVEIMARANQNVTGAGPCFLLWPASNDHWPPEVDILETPNGQGMFTNHWAGPKGNGDDRYEATYFDIDYTKWHVYGLEWTPTYLRLMVDGKEIKTLRQNVPKEAMSVALQGHVGAVADVWYGGSPNAFGVKSVEIIIDFVRVSAWNSGN